MFACIPNTKWALHDFESSAGAPLLRARQGAGHAGQKWMPRKTLLLSSVDRRLAEKEKIGTRFTGVRERRRTDDGDSGRVRRLASLTHARFLEETVGRGQGGALSRDMKDRNKSTKGAGNAHSSPKTPHTGTIRRGPTTGDKGVGKSPSDHSPLAGKTLNFGGATHVRCVSCIERWEGWEGRKARRLRFGRASRQLRFARARSDVAAGVCEGRGLGRAAGVAVPQPGAWGGPGGALWADQVGFPLPAAADAPNAGLQRPGHGHGRADPFAAALTLTSSAASQSNPRRATAM